MLIEKLTNSELSIIFWGVFILHIPQLLCKYAGVRKIFIFEVKNIETCRYFTFNELIIFHVVAISVLIFLVFNNKEREQ